MPHLSSSGKGTSKPEQGIASPARMASIKNTKDNTDDDVEKRDRAFLVRCRRGCKLTQPPEKIRQGFLKDLKLGPPYEPTDPLRNN